MKKVAIIIVNFNGFKYLPDLLGSIFSFRSFKVFSEVIFIDNNSTDASISYVKKNYPQVKILAQKANYGFAKGNNLGFRYAIENNFDYVFLLNQDTLVTAGYLDKLVDKIESNNNISAVQPCIKLYPQTDLLNSLGCRIHYLGFGYTYGNNQPTNTLKELKANFDNLNYCSGAAVLIKVRVLKQSGLFNSSFFMYHEDLDLGWRFQLLGFKNVLEPEAIIYHKYEFSKSIQKYYFMERNRFIVILQNYKLGTLVLILPALLAMELGLLLFAIKNGFLLQKLKVYAYLLNPQNLVRIRNCRRQIQRTRKILDKDIVKNFSGVIEHQAVSNSLINNLINPIFNFYWQIVKKIIVW